MRLSAFLSLGISFWKMKKIFLLQKMGKMRLPFFHDASIWVSVGVFLTHRFETAGVLPIFFASETQNAPYLELCKILPDILPP